MAQSSIYNFRKVRIDEVGKLQTFLDSHWKKGHSLVKSKALLDWQHLDKNEGCYNFIIAENITTGEFDAIIGYIPLAQYDPILSDNGNYWGAIWKIREDLSNSEINSAGFFLWRRLFKLPNFKSYAAVGISNIAKQIYIASRIPVSVLSQYYILNEETTDFKIAKIAEKPIANEESKGRFRLAWFDNIDWNKIGLEGYYKPIKTKTYFKNRYSSHPVYKYYFIGLYDSDELKAMLVCRVINITGSKVIRIVDVLGQLEGSLYKEFQRIMKEQNAEYIDFMNFGIDELVFTKMGFVKLDLEGKNIIPNYFEPFEPCNVKLEIAYKSIYSDYVVFKGDSDQDRPNIL